MSEKMKKLECPFTWEIDQTLSGEFDETEELVADVNEEPLFAFINSVALIYFQAEKDYKKAVEKLKTLEDFWEQLDEKQLNIFGVSTRVIQHIKEATKYYIYKSSNRESEAIDTLAKLEDAKNFHTHVELATINGCKSIIWSKFYEKAHRQVTEFAKLAILGSPDCPLWHYMIAKSLRQRRREGYGIDKPLPEEEESVLRSYQLSDTPFYKMRLAQMYREKKMIEKVKEIYLEVYKTNPMGHETLLKLARGYTLLREYVKAEMCFDKVAENYSENMMYHYYKGIFFIKTQEYKEAAFHLKKAAKRDNYRADLIYAWAMSKKNRRFDFIAHLKMMLKKYNNNSKVKQATLLHITMHYYYKKNDLKNTLKYLLQAVEVDPKSPQLKKYTNTTINFNKLNIYDFAHEKLQEFDVQVESAEEMQDSIKKLNDYYQQHCRHNLEDFSIV